MSQGFLGNLGEGWSFEGGILAFLLSIQVCEVFQNNHFIFEKHFEIFKTIAAPLSHLIQTTLKVLGKFFHFTDEKVKATEVTSLFKAGFLN